MLRSEAVGILASPVKALALLRWAETNLGDAAQGTASPGGAEISGLEPADRPAVVLDDSLDPEQFRPRAVLYVHSEESFRRRTRGAVRVEGVGPVTVEQSTDFLRHCHVTVRPVVDLNDNPSADR